MLETRSICEEVVNCQNECYRGTGIDVNDNGYGLCWAVLIGVDENWVGNNSWFCYCKLRRSGSELHISGKGVDELCNHYDVDEVMEMGIIKLSGIEYDLSWSWLGSECVRIMIQLLVQIDMFELQNTYNELGWTECCECMNFSLWDCKYVG